jgi:hypothetical protein
MTLLQQCLDVRQGGVVQRKLSYAQTLYKDCKGFYLHAICKSPLALQRAVAFLEFGILITDLLTRALEDDAGQTPDLGPTGQSESAEVHQPAMLKESKGKGRLEESADGAEAEVVVSHKAELQQEQLLRNKRRSLRTSAALLGAKMRTAQGAEQTGSRADLFLQAQQIVGHPLIPSFCLV